MNYRKIRIAKKMSKINVLIIDSYISKNHPQLIDDTIYNIRDDSFIPNEELGHGTAIYGILRKNSDKANFYLFPINDGISEEELLYALDYVAKYNVVFDLINISLGISYCENKAQLYTLCEKLIKKGSILISAFNNDGSISFPAAFKNVIGVSSSDVCKKTSDFEFYEDDVLNISAKGGIQRLLWSTPQYIFLSGNSFACAHVCSQAIHFLYDSKCSYKELLNRFKSIAKKVHHYNRIEDSNQLISIPFKMNQVALFPFNKEMHSIIRYQELLNFYVVGVYDTKKSIYLGNKISNILKDVDSELVIQNIACFDSSSVDTIIIGHTNFLNEEKENEEIKIFLNEMIEKGINIYSFENILQKNRFSHYYFPSICQEQCFPYRNGMLYRITTPVLAFMGTSSSQGKFTLQLAIRKRFLRDGYVVGEIGTEPTSLLFSMDAVIPMGYHSTVEIYGNDLISYVNNTIYHITEKENIDIILAGSQAGTVCYDTGNLTRFNVDVYSYMLAIDPDFVILSINPYDSVTYLKRTIHFIESAFNTKVIGLVIFPFGLKQGYFSIYNAKEYLGKEKYYEIKMNLENELHIKVYKLDEIDDMNNLYTYIIKCFE